MKRVFIGLLSLIIIITFSFVPTYAAPNSGTGNTIIVEKIIENNLGDNTAFEVILFKDRAEYARGRITKDNSVTFTNVPTGDYTLTELPAEGYELVSISPTLTRVRGKNNSYKITVTNRMIVVNPPPTQPTNPVVDTQVSATSVNVGDTLSASTLSGTFKDATTSVALDGTLAWSNPSTIVNATGNFAWTFTPTDLSLYNQVTGTVEVIANPVIVQPTDPVIDTPVSATSVNVGDTLSASTLSGTFKDATTSVAVDGILAWSDSDIVVNKSGNFEWAFTPTDLYRYKQVTGTVEVIANPVIVQPTDPVVDTPVSATSVNVGDTLSASILSGTFKDVTTNVAVDGTLAWSDSDIVVNESGNFEWTFTPADQSLYNQVTGTVEVVALANPVVPTPKVINYVALGDSLATGTTSRGTTKSYIFGFRDYLKSVYPDATISMENLSVDGHTARNLLDLLDNPTVAQTVRNANIITISIGGNNILKAGKDGFSRVDHQMAEEGTLAFENDYPLIIERIRELNSSAKIIAMTLFNPYNTVSIRYYTNDPQLHEEVKPYVERINAKILGVNDNKYRVADVYTHFLINYANKGKMGDVTYFYPNALLKFTRDPHPNQTGQNEMVKIHNQVFVGF